MGKYVLKAAKKGFHFNLCAGNNQVIGTSEIYSSINYFDTRTSPLRYNLSFFSKIFKYSLQG